jgi:ketosteroid isomerase-like protein
MRLVLLIFSLILSGCCMTIDLDKEKLELLQTDIEFSNLSVEKGATFAFHEYLADDGIVLPFFDAPRTKSDYASMLELAQNSEPDKSTLKWAPEFADVAASGDFGYTWGRYIFTAADASESRGFYVTIWKKQVDDQWKFVFDAGNQLK